MIGTQPPHYAPIGFNVRDASLDDVEELTRLWYASFNTSHKFWDIMTPDNESTRQWWRDLWTMGINAGSTSLRTVVVEDLSQNRRLAGFARWNVPQADGKQDIPLPPYLSEWDPELTEAFWGGMPINRLEVMGQRPHWMLEFLGVDKKYQEKGLGYTLVEWGCRQADSEGLEVYLDATIKGLPFYKKHFGFQDRKLLLIPPRLETFGTYELMAVVRPARQQRAMDTVKKSPAVVTVTEVVDIVV